MKKVYLDILNIMACFAVVVLHCTSKAWQVDGTLSWKIAICLQGLFIWAVTIFFMLSGAKCMNYRERYSTKVFLRKRVLKTLLIVSGFSLFYIVFYSAVGRVHYESVFGAIKALLNNEVVSIFWFFSRLIPLYLIMPIVSMLDNKIKQYFVLLAFMSNFAIPNIDKYFDLKLSGYTLPFANVIVALAVLGSIFDTNEINKKIRVLIYLLAIFSMFFNIVMTIRMSLNANEYLKTYITSTSFTTIMVACGLWIFVKEIFTNRISLDEKANKILREISSCCLGVYLIQPVFLQIAGMLDIDKSTPIYSVIASLVIFNISILLVWIWRRGNAKIKKERI